MDGKCPPLMDVSNTYVCAGKPLYACSLTAGSITKFDIISSPVETQSVDMSYCAGQFGYAVPFVYPYPDTTYDGFVDVELTPYRTVTGIQRYQEYLDSMELLCLIPSIRSFWGKDMGAMTDMDILKSIIRIISSNGRVVSCIPVLHFPRRSLKFFRVRETHGQIFLTEGEYREPSRDICRYNGRFDAWEDPTLYVSMSELAAMYETIGDRRVGYEETVFVNEDSLDLMAVLPPGHPLLPKSYYDLSPLQLRKKWHIDMFLYELLMMPDIGMNENHRISKLAAWCLFDRIGADGIIYPSLKSRGEYDLNVAFFNAKHHLRAKYALYRDGDSNAIQCGIMFHKGIADSSEGIQQFVRDERNVDDQWCANMGYLMVDR